MPKMFARASSDIELGKQVFEVRFIDDEFGPFGFKLLRFVQRLKEPKFRDSVFFSAREYAAYSTSPFIHGRLLDEDSQREYMLAVNGNHVNILRPCRESTLRLLHFVEIVLINVASGCRIAFNAPNGLGAAHSGIIRGSRGDVNWSSRFPVKLEIVSGLRRDLLHLEGTDLSAKLLRSFGGLVRGNPQKNAEESGADQKDNQSELFERRRGPSGRLSTALGFRF